MEANLRWTAVAMVAPIAWGSTYFVTRQFLPADIPLWGAVLRALPAGLLLLAVRPRMPRGAWWWRAPVLGALNMGAFFVLVYLAAQLLPTTIASMIMATSPVVMMLFAWLLVSERLRALSLVGAAIGVAGVVLMLLGGAASVDPRGVVAAVAAMTMASFGYTLAKRWGGDVDAISLSSWQLIAGGILLVPFAVMWEGAPPALDPPALAAFAYVGVVATAVAFVAWFSALRRLDAGAVGLIGLLNPVTGVLLGTLVAGEALSPNQAGGMALVLVGIVIGQPVAARAVATWRSRRRPTDAAAPASMATSRPVHARP